MAPLRYFLFCCLFLFCSVGDIKAQKLPQLGMATSLDNDSLLYASGFRLIGTSVSSLISPSLTEEEFQANIKKIKAAKCKVYMCNVLFPGNIKIAGPDVVEAKVLEHLDVVLARAQKAGIKNLVLGSGGARRLPADYDKEKAKEEFAALCKKMAALAEHYKVTIILESLNSTETNFINTLKEAAEVVRKVNHPYFRLNADIYHMLKENESPQEIILAKDIIVYSEIAEKEGRTLPGVAGQDFRPYLKALQTIKFYGPIIIEGRTNDMKTDVPRAYHYLTAQLKEVYDKK